MKPSERIDGSRTIVVAHDDAGLRHTLIEYLRNGKYNVFEAPDLPTMVQSCSNADSTNRSAADGYEHGEALLGQKATESSPDDDCLVRRKLAGIETPGRVNA